MRAGFWSWAMRSLSSASAERGEYLPRNASSAANSATMPIKMDSATPSSRKQRRTDGTETGARGVLVRSGKIAKKACRAIKIAILTMKLVGGSVKPNSEGMRKHATIPSPTSSQEVDQRESRKLTPAVSDEFDSACIEKMMRDEVCSSRCFGVKIHARP